MINNEKNCHLVTKHLRLGWGLGGLLLSCLLFFTACSEEDATEDEYANWQQRNETFFASLQDSLSASTSSWSQSWQRYKNFSLDQKTEGSLTDYIYVKKLVESSATESPAYTDSVRVSYQGRLIPTTSNPEGYVFDTTVYDSYSISTTSTTKFLTSGVVDGFTTALLHMHRGDRWRIFIPYNLGYGATAKSTVPAYSTLIFDVTLIDFSPAGKPMPLWKTPRK